MQASGVVVTMGRGDACPYLPGKRYEDWKLVDSAGRGIDAVRPISNDSREHPAVLEAGPSPSESDLVRA